MNFGVISLPQLNKHSLGSLNFPRGIIVFLLGLVFFLGSTEQYKAMKIGITFFGSKMDLLCISKVLTIFYVFSKIRWKETLPGTRGMLAECPGWSPCVGALGARPTRRAPGRGSRGSATRDTWRAREHPGEVSRQGYSGTGVLLGGLPDEAYGLGTRGQVAYSEASGGRLTAGILGGRRRV